MGRTHNTATAVDSREARRLDEQIAQAKKDYVAARDAHSRAQNVYNGAIFQRDRLSAATNAAIDRFHDRLCELASPLIGAFLEQLNPESSGWLLPLSLTERLRGRDAASAARRALETARSDAAALTTEDLDDDAIFVRLQALLDQVGASCELPKKVLRIDRQGELALTAAN